MIRTRFSPSPTGMLHLGNARAALFSALYALKEQGIFILRIEDTDAARSEHKYTEMLQDDLHWLGVAWQEGPGVGGPHQPYWQSQRHEIYDGYYKKLEDMGKVYPCFCSDQELALNRKLQLSRGQAPRYPGTCRKLSKEDIAKKIADGAKPTLRFMVPTSSMIEFNDLVKGTQRFNSDDIGDFIIRRADGSSSFLFSNAIDDSLMQVSHVLRGDDHLANTPRQLMILQTLNMPTAQYGHLSMITGDDGSPLSKRHGSFSLHDLSQQGYLPRAVVNYLGRLSHAYASLELMTYQELATNFQLEKLSRAPARFDKAQLMHWQKEAVLLLNAAEVWAWLGDDVRHKTPETKQEVFAEMMRQNILFPQDAHKWVDIFFGDDLQFTHDQIEVLKEAGTEFFVAAQDAVKTCGIDIKAILDKLKTACAVSGKKLFMPVRIALTGENHGPELNPIATLLGAEKMHQRFSRALELVTC